MEAWRKVWREGVVPLLTREQLLHLKEGLERNDPTLIQGATTTPPPLACVQDWPVTGGCLLSYTGWKDGLETVGEVEEYFVRICAAIDERMGEPAACRTVLNWYDETPRDEVVVLLLEETYLAIEEKLRREEETPTP